MSCEPTLRSTATSFSGPAIHRGFTSRVEAALRGALAEAGIVLDGDRPFDPRVKDAALFRAARRGLLGWREAFVEGWWDVERLDVLTEMLIRRQLESDDGTVRSRLLGWGSTLGRFASWLRGARPVSAHYNLGNDLFAAMLDRRMIYSCALWDSATTLDAAQEAKLDLVCRKLGLQAGMRVLDIGCGWGGFARFAAENYGAHVVGITIAEEQLVLGREHCRGLPVELRLQDYRDVDETFDAIVSIGMFEHVGRSDARRFMRVVRRCLRPDGLALLHTIGCRSPREDRDEWTNRYVFQGTLPTAARLAAACEDVLLIEDWQNLGAHYDPTLMAWHANFDAAWPRLRDTYGERFRRLWSCYLLTCAGVFRARSNQVWQLVLAPRGRRGGYTSVR